MGLTILKPSPESSRKAVVTCPVRAGNPKIVSGHDGREMNSSHAQNSEMTRDASYRARSRWVASRIRQNLRIDVRGCVLKVSGCSRHQSATMTCHTAAALPSACATARGVVGTWHHVGWRPQDGRPWASRLPTEAMASLLTPAIGRRGGPFAFSREAKE